MWGAEESPTISPLYLPCVALGYQHQGLASNTVIPNTHPPQLLSSGCLEIRIVLPSFFNILYFISDPLKKSHNLMIAFYYTLACLCLNYSILSFCQAQYFVPTPLRLLCMDFCYLLLLCMEFVYSVSVPLPGWFHEGHTMSFCHHIPVLTRLRLWRHTFNSASLIWYPRCLLFFILLGPGASILPGVCQELDTYLASIKMPNYLCKI